MHEFSLSPFKKIGFAAFTILFWTISFAWMAILAVVTLLMLLIFPYTKVHGWVPAPGFRMIAKFATLGQFRIIFDPAFDPNRQSVFLMNHTNLLDAHVASSVIPHAFCGLMNSWQRHIPFYGWLMRLSHGIFVDRKKGKVLDQISTAAKERRTVGLSILTFPEAHRTLDGQIRPFRKGIFFMAREAGYPVVPMAARGMFDVNRKGSLMFHPKPIEVYVGAQLETENLSDKEIDDLAKRSREIMANFIETGFSNENIEWSKKVARA